MSNQFIHFNRYGRVARKGEPKFASISGVLKEAGRAVGAMPHVAKPLPPLQIFGIPLGEVENTALTLSSTARDAMHRKLRRDGPTLMAVVVSYPIPIAELTQAGKSDRQTFVAWVHAVESYFKETTGSQLLAIIAHRDELFPHLHIYAVPTLDERDQTLDWSIHPGMRAKQRAARDGKSKKEQDAAYREAMCLLQDDFYERVSRAFGHDRDGPKRARFARRDLPTNVRTPATRAHREPSFKGPL